MSDTPKENPLRAGLRLEKVADPCVVVILGASGDLTKRKLVPALYRLVQQRLIPGEFAIVGGARSQMSNDEFRDAMKSALVEFSEIKQVDEEVWKSFAQNLFYVTLDIKSEADFKELLSIPSVSSLSSHRADCRRAADWTAARLRPARRRK